MNEFIVLLKLLNSVKKATLFKVIIVMLHFLMFHKLKNVNLF